MYPRHPSLELPADANEDIVDNINLAVEQIFIILGNRGMCHTTKLSLLVPAELFPGVQLASSTEDGHDLTFTMDLPNLIQKFCQQYTESPYCRAPLEAY